MSDEENGRPRIRGGGRQVSTSAPAKRVCVDDAGIAVSEYAHGSSWIDRGRRWHSDIVRVYRRLRTDRERSADFHKQVFRWFKGDEDAGLTLRLRLRTGQREVWSRGR
jgi:hypothetical protein